MWVHVYVSVGGWVCFEMCKDVVINFGFRCNDGCCVDEDAVLTHTHPTPTRTQILCHRMSVKGGGKARSMAANQDFSQRATSRSQAKSPYQVSPCLWDTSTPAHRASHNLPLALALVCAIGVCVCVRATRSLSIYPHNPGNSDPSSPPTAS
jgi:hypothetical protein